MKLDSVGQSPALYIKNNLMLNVYNFIKLTELTQSPTVGVRINVKMFVDIVNHIAT